MEYWSGLFHPFFVFDLNRLRTCELKPNQTYGVALFIQEVDFDSYCLVYFERITQVSFLNVPLPSDREGN